MAIPGGLTAHLTALAPYALASGALFGSIHFHLFDHFELPHSKVIQDIRKNRQTREQFLAQFKEELEKVKLEKQAILKSGGDIKTWKKIGRHQKRRKVESLNQQTENSYLTPASFVTNTDITEDDLDLASGLLVLTTKDGDTTIITQECLVDAIQDILKVEESQE